jgi:selenocysteine-specific elongation factor
MTKHLILGTAGHIDHGKTTLIRCLTGVDTDRLPEEKRRGITIELGFAELDLGDYRLGIVDVPGHERFVRQMLSGATGMDLAMLVVAADDSVKPQTREHLDVLRMLDLRAGVIVLTKADAVEPGWLELVRDEVRELVRGTFLEHAPIVATSSVTGQGLDVLRDALRAAAEEVGTRADARLAAPFRMAIDRAFTVAGHGTVVTGSVTSGQVSVEDSLEVLPGGVLVRVRGLQSHDRRVTTVASGQRAAINLAGIHHDQVRRGDELASPGVLLPSRLVTAWLEVLPTAAHPLKRRELVRFHVGTAEVLARVVPLDTERMEAGQSGLVQLFLREPVATTWDQPFVLRSESPVQTVAGGRVLVPKAAKIRRASSRILERLHALRSQEHATRADAALYFAGPTIHGAQDLRRIAGVVAPDAVFEELVKSAAIVKTQGSGQRLIWLHAGRLEENAERVVAALNRLHDASPLQRMFDRSLIAGRFQHWGDPAVLEATLAVLRKQRRIQQTDRMLGLSDRGPQLVKGEQELLDQLVERYRSAGLQPPTVAECREAATKHQKSVPSLLKLAVVDGLLVEVGKDLYLHASVAEEMRRVLKEEFQRRGAMTVSDIRDILQVSRKYAVPFCEYLDRSGFTIREGDLRRLSPSGEQATV